jgi:hypothetical protein
MKQFILILIFSFGLILASPAFAREQSLLARVTVYWASGGGGSDAYTRAHRCSTGARLRAGHCAVDPKKIAYGSKVVFSDATCVAVDTGRDVVNRKAARRSGRTATERSALVIDRFFETKGQALRWAKAHPQFMTVRVLLPNEQMIESKNAKVIAKQSGPPNARGNSQNAAKQNPTGIAKKIAANDPVNPPQNKLVAANVNQAGDFLSRRF